MMAIATLARLLGVIVMSSAVGSTGGSGPEPGNGARPLQGGSDAVGLVRIIRPDPHCDGWFKPFPDTNRLLMYSRAPAETKGELFVWDVQRGEKVWRLPPDEKRPEGLTVLPDGRRMLVNDIATHSKVLWDLQTNREVGRFEGHHDHIVGFELLPDGKRFITIGQDCYAHVWLLDDPELDIGSFDDHEHRLTALAVSPDGGRAVTSDEYGNLFLWDTRTCKQIRRLPKIIDRKYTPPPVGIIRDPQGNPAIFPIDNGVSVRRLAFFPDGRRIAVGTIWSHHSKESAVIVFDTETGREVARHRERSEQGEITALAVSPDGRRILFAPWTGPIRLWDLEGNKIVSEFEGHVMIEHGWGSAGRPGGVGRVTFTADGKHALSGGEDGTVRLWKLPE